MRLYPILKGSINYNYFISDNITISLTSQYGFDLLYMASQYALSRLIIIIIEYINTNIKTKLESHRDLFLF